jgi:D-alanyl-D-alanine carboxypeptidase
MTKTHKNFGRLVASYKEEIGASLLLLALVGVAGWLFWQQHLAIATLEGKVAQLRSDTASTTAQLDAVIAVLTEDLSDTQARATELADILSSKEQQLNNIASQVGGISGTVTTLEKLSKTDPELLAKYSKVYFLNENYTPERLIEIEKEHLYSEDSPELINVRVQPFLSALLNAAASDDVPLYVKSAYRSFDEQKSLKSVYSVTYGAGTANTFSADQGYSEHQLGTTVDFITTGLNGQLTVQFESTAAYTWLQNNAHTFGFVLSYPKGNSFYIYEPWHWRFVGVTLAKSLHEQGKHFYDLDQRDIDVYLVNIFD